jgi:hypothetical protein
MPLTTADLLLFKTREGLWSVRVTLGETVIRTEPHYSRSVAIARAAVVIDLHEAREAK